MTDTRTRTTHDSSGSYNQDLFPELPEILAVLRCIDESLQTLAANTASAARAISTAMQGTGSHVST